MTVYLIHAENGKHYTGWSDGPVWERIERHRKTISTPPAEGQVKWKKTGPGAKLLGVFNFRKVRWEVVRVWPGADQSFERLLKNWHGAREYCPACLGDKALKRAQYDPGRYVDFDIDAPDALARVLGEL
jgi:hypothetical protein